MEHIHWVECVACTKPLPKPRIRKWEWEKILDGGCFQLWICKQDLKEQFVAEAKIAFGKTLEQVIRLGSTPTVLYPTEEADNG
jgi:hypothetical protein